MADCAPRIRMRRGGSGAGAWRRGSDHEIACGAFMAGPRASVVASSARSSTSTLRSAVQSATRDGAERRKAGSAIEFISNLRHAADKVGGHSRIEVGEERVQPRIAVMERLA